MKVFGWIFIVLFVWSTNAIGAVLSCNHIPVIQEGFLNQHFLNLKKPSFELEERVVDQYIKRLDPSKLYLTRGDVKKVKKHLKGILMRIQSKDCSPIMKIYGILEKRVIERVDFVKDFLGSKYVFNKAVSLNLDPDSRKRPRSTKTINDFHKKYLHFKISNYLASDIKLPEAKKKVIKNYERILKKIKFLSQEDKLIGYLDSFARALDPHSSYFSKDDLENFKIQMNLSLEGIGATLRWEDGFTIVESLVEGGAAFRNGELKSGDKIIAVSQGPNKQMENVIDMDLGDVVKKIRGKKGTPVHLTVLRKSGESTQRKVVKLKRDKINLKDEEASITYYKRKIGGKERLIGVINLPSFYLGKPKEGIPPAFKGIANLLKKANKKKVAGVVLDLSNNGGGSLDDAVKISGLFFKTGSVVKQSTRQSKRFRFLKRRKGKALPKGFRSHSSVLKDINSKVNYAGPLVILTSRISASASEIVAGSLQDYKRAVIVGADHTFGKGTIQSVVELPHLGALKVTVGMFFIPGGYSTQHRGVVSDISFPSVLETDDLGEKTYDYSLSPQKLDPFVSSEAFVTEGRSKWKILDKKTIKTLNMASSQRILESQEFQEIQKDLEKNLKRRDKVIHLTEVMKEKADDKKEEVKGPLNKKQKLEKYRNRPEIKESINIVVDLIALQENIPLPQSHKKTAQKKK